MGSGRHLPLGDLSTHLPPTPQNKNPNILAYDVSILLVHFPYSGHIYVFEYVFEY